MLAAGGTQLSWGYHKMKRFIKALAAFCLPMSLLTLAACSSQPKPKSQVTTSELAAWSQEAAVVDCQTVKARYMSLELVTGRVAENSLFKHKQTPEDAQLLAMGQVFPATRNAYAREFNTRCTGAQ
jgi:hypothetical protein